MAKNKTYFIFEVGAAGQMNPGNEEFYGWTHHKEICEGFLKQRADIGIQYDISKYDNDDIPNDIESLIQDDYMIDILSVQSCMNGTNMDIFMTEYEMIEIESAIRESFTDIIQELYNEINVLHDGANTTESISRVEYIYTSLDTKYVDALMMIGYSPIDFDSMCLTNNSEFENYMFESTARLKSEYREYYHNTIFNRTVSSFESVASVLGMYANKKLNRREGKQN